jgi:predicted MPP superfamily phosphohydrolase
MPASGRTGTGSPVHLPRSRLTRRTRTYGHLDGWLYCNALVRRLGERLFPRFPIGTPAVERVGVPIEGLPPGLDGLRIVQLSDFHLRPFAQPPLVERAVECARRLDPHLVALTGDYVYGRAGDAADVARIVSELEAPLGTYAVLGNHDHWTDARVVLRGLSRWGIRVLVNEGVPLSHDGATLWIAGVDDAMSGTPDFDAALAGRPAGAPAVLLVHEPDVADTLPPDGPVVLQLSGHSHGGQIRLPGGIAPVLPPLGRRYPWGLRRAPGHWVYTNRGLGVGGIPLRWNNPPEVTLLTLAPAGDGR